MSKPNTNSPNEEQYKDRVILNRRTLLKATATAAAAAAAGALSAGKVMAYDAPEAVKKSLEKTGRVRLPFGQAERNWLANIVNWYEFPTKDPEVLEVWAYCDKLSYAPGDEVALHVNTTAPNYNIEIFRDGGKLESVYKKTDVPGAYHETPIKAYESGCNWPVSTRIKIPSDWKSGGYVVVLSVEKDGKRIEHEAFFILRAKNPGARSKILFMPAIPTWIAYNDWGGGCSYRLPPEAGGGGREARETSYAIYTSTHKPWPRGFIRLPEVAVNSAQAMTEYGDRAIGWEPAYPNMDYAFANGYSMFCSIAGWAAYDRHFAIWAEQAGYEIEYACMHDIMDNPNLLKNYNVIVQVGHDEYHTYEYRQAVDAHLARGGKVMRTGGNILWKVRWEGDKNRQIYFKHGRRKEDPMYANSADRKRLTVGWHHFESPTEPPVTTWGVNGHKGVYAQVGGSTPRGSGGFTIYRNKHWVFEGTDLYYGDVLGGLGNVPLVGFEVDGVDFTFRHGLPYPTGEDGSPKNLEILGLAPATAAEETDHGHPSDIYFYGDIYADAKELAADLNIKPTKENLEKMIYGNCAMTYLKKGAGEIFAAGTCNWVIKLLERDPFVERITKNVIDRFSV
ncbi:MAG: hypothetical protein PVH58_17785 [Desulfobacterales bacterium]|jgi:hypothetical protein